MLLPPAANRFRSLPVAAGLRSLLVQPPDAAGRRVVTRATAVAMRGDTTARCCCRGGEDVVKASGDGTSITRQSEDIKKANDDDDDQEDTKAADKEMEKEAGSAEEEEDEELDGFWVSYGRRCPRRRLPPPIPSLVPRGALRRARTGDGRLVIRIVPVVRPERVRARRRRGGDSLTMRLVERDDDSTVMAPSLIQHEDAIGSARASGHDDAATPAIRDDEFVHDVADAAPEPETTTAPVAVPPPRVSSVGCFEEVFRFDTIGGGSLHQMPSRLRMVH